MALETIFYDGKFEIHFIELQKASKYAHSSMKDLWLKFLSAKTEKEWKMLAIQNPMLKKAIDKTVKMSADKDVRFAMIAMEKIERDRISALSNAEARGEARGEAKGEARILALLEKGATLDEIKKILSQKNDNAEKND